MLEAGVFAHVMGSIYLQLEPVELSDVALNQPLPLGPEGLLHGTLDNGLK